MAATTPAANLAAQLSKDAQRSGPKWSGWIDGPDGASYRARITADNDSNPFGKHEWLGELHAPRRDGENRRPDACDGSAVKLRTRQGMVWWQPPADVKNDAEGLKTTRERAESYLLEHWYMVGVMVERRAVTCQHCGGTTTEDAALWGIESDAGDYFAEVIADLIHELTPTVAASPAQ